MNFRQKLVVAVLVHFQRNMGLGRILLIFLSNGSRVNLLHYNFTAQVFRRRIFYFMDKFAVITLLILNYKDLLLPAAFSIHLWRDTLDPITRCSLGLKKIHV